MQRADHRIYSVYMNSTVGSYIEPYGTRDGTPSASDDMWGKLEQILFSLGNVLVPQCFNGNLVKAVKARMTCPANYPGLREAYTIV